MPKKFYEIDTWCQCYKPFFCNLQSFVISQSVCPRQAFPAESIVSDKARSLPYSGAPERCFNRVGSFFKNRHYIRLERLAMDKHSSLLRTILNYGCKKFYNIGPRGLYYKTFYGSNCCCIIISQNVCHFLLLPPQSNIWRQASIMPEQSPMH